MKRTLFVALAVAVMLMGIVAYASAVGNTVAVTATVNPMLTLTVDNGDETISLVGDPGDDVVSDKAVRSRPTSFSARSSPPRVPKVSTTQRPRPPEVSITLRLSRLTSATARPTTGPTPERSSRPSRIPWSRANAAPAGGLKDSPGPRKAPLGRTRAGLLAALAVPAAARATTPEQPLILAWQPPSVDQ
jgi:hypothetical protein